jgi:hypothetical protein
MKVTMEMDGDGVAANEFYHWLLRDDDMRAAEVTRPPGEGHGHMGVLEVVDVVLSNAIALGTLVATYASWRKARPNGPTVTFTVGDVTVSATDASPETLGRIAEVLGASGASS